VTIYRQLFVTQLAFCTFHINQTHNTTSLCNSQQQPQHEHMERHKKLHGVRMDKMERDRKREARKVHKVSAFAQKSFGWTAKMFNQKRFKEKAALRKTINMHQEGSNKHANDDAVTDGAVPAYLLDRENVSRAKILSNTGSCAACMCHHLFLPRSYFVPLDFALPLRNNQ
jgi:hypothetical protein